MEENKKSLLKTLIWAIALVLVAFIGSNAYQNSRKQQINLNSIATNWSKLLAVMQTMDENYVDEIDHSKIIEDILPKLMQELDPHSVYLPVEDLQQAEESLQGGFDGIGVQFTVPSDTAIISNVIVGGPSEKAGLQNGDRIIKVDDRIIAGVGMAQDSMVKLMKGQKGTKVQISVKRHDVYDLIAFEIGRASCRERV